ncbi:hypothetical protein [Caryophanon latum]|uniref:Uncharacterized protein n=1 Tax=Caryophanon latum TaxID=33977 RepID=A0A1C0YUJ7_9BACL|nr:hypothetical protein [Caryophanon latum]OCS90832.1 hypothetical protein A6K76_01920 [Caryophanon latum]
MKKIIFIALVTIAIIVGGTGYYFWDKKRDEQEYQKEMTMLLNEIELSIAESAIIGATYQKYWGDIIDAPISLDTITKNLEVTESIIEPLLNYDNSSNTYLGRVIQKGSFNTMISIIRIAKADATDNALDRSNQISERLSKLKNPPSKYENDYNALLELFEEYNTFVNISTDPAGSYIEFSRTLNSTYESVESKLETTKIQIN